MAPGGTLGLPAYLDQAQVQCLVDGLAAGAHSQFSIDMLDV